ncbi:hypothetical protein ACJX0J_024006, partial [Zea mays]
MTKCAFLVLTYQQCLGIEEMSLIWFFGWIFLRLTFPLYNVILIGVEPFISIHYWIVHNIIIVLAHETTLIARFGTNIMMLQYILSKIYEIKWKIILHEVTLSIIDGLVDELHLIIISKERQKQEIQMPHLAVFCNPRRTKELSLWGNPIVFIKSQRECLFHQSLMHL